MIGARSISATSNCITSPSRPASSYSTGTSAAQTSSWRSSGETATTRHAPPSDGQAAASISTLRVWTAPTMRTEWGVPAGIHTARSGGATHAPSGVLTATTPLAA